MHSCELTPLHRDRFLAGELTSAERRTVLEHLVGGCAACRAHFAGHLSPGRRRAVSGAGYEETSERVSDSLAKLIELRDRIEVERRAAADLFERFRAYPPKRQWTLIRNSRRVDSAEFFRLVVEAGYQAIYDDPRRTLELAEMARTIAERLDTASYSAALCADLRSRAWRHIGNARRALANLAGAAEALQAARGELELGTGDPLEEAEQLYFESSLLRAERRLDEALRRVRRARRLYSILGETHLAGHMDTAEASILQVMGRDAEALDRMRRAIRKIDPERDSRLALAVRHNLAWALQAAGQVEEALATLAELRPRYFELGDRLTLLRLRWLEAQIYRQQGRGDEAETALREAMVGFAVAETPYEVANVALELALLLGERGETAQVRALAAETLQIFRSLGVEREAIAAWLLFQQAIEAEAVTAALIERLSRYYQAAKHQPGLRFELGA